MAISSRRLSCLVMMALLGAAPVSAQSGIITGTVRDAVTRAPVVTGIVLCLEARSWCGTGSCLEARSWCGTGSFTNSAGVYRIEVSPGTYYVYTSGAADSRVYVDEIFPDILCPGICEPATALQSGAPLLVTAGATVRADFDLDRGGTITGTVTDSRTSAPLLSLSVVASMLIGDELRPVAQTGADFTGRYVFEGLPAGRYYVHTDQSMIISVNEVFDNVPCRWDCSSDDLLAGVPIAVAPGTTTGERNFALDRGGRITGTVTDAVTTLPLSEVCVTAFVSFADLPLGGSLGCTDLRGRYDLGGLPAGSYHLIATPVFGSGYVQELYDAVPCPAAGCDPDSGTPVTVELGATTGGRDFSLELGGAIRGSVRDAATGLASLSGEILIYSIAGTLIRTVGRGTVCCQTGEYVVYGLPAGTYYAYSSLSGYRNEVFDGVRCREQFCTDQELLTLGTPVSVTSGGTTAGIDFAVGNDLAPGVPAGLTASVNGATVTLSWAPPSEGGAPASYLLEAGASPGATFVQQPVTGSPYAVMSVAPGRYFVRVRAVNANGAGPASDDVLVIIGGAGSPPSTAAVNLVGWMSGPRLTLTWGAPPSAAGLTGYVVEAGSATGITDLAHLCVNARALTFSPVGAGYYFVRVRAMNAHGLGPASNEVLINSGYVPAPPEPPRSLFVRVSGSTVTLEWSPSFGGPPAGYVIRAGSAPGLSDLAEAASGAGETARSFSGVPVGVYYVRVHAVGALGLGPPSSEATVIVR